jgi:hypothetical protein
MEVVYRNSSQSRKHKPFLIFSAKGKLHLFTGRAIGGVVSVKDRNCWDTGVIVYTLEVNPNARVISGNEFLDNRCIALGLEESFGKKLLTWNDCSKAFETSVEEVSSFIGAHWPTTANAFNIYKDMRTCYSDILSGKTEAVF